MIVEVPLQLWAAAGRADAWRELHAALAAAYAGERFVEVACAARRPRRLKALDPRR